MTVRVIYGVRDLVDFGETSIRLGVATDHLEILADGTVVLHGAATAWDDLLPNAVSVGVGAAAPSFTAYNGNLRAYEFTGAATEKEMQMQWQMSHAWLLGSAIEPHVHLYVPNDATGGVVKFRCEYTWTNINSPEVATATISGTLIIAANAGAYHRLLAFPEVDGTGKTLSSIFSARIYRNPTDSEDTFGSSVWLKAADLHYQIDSFGSSEEYTK